MPAHGKYTVNEAGLGRYTRESKQLDVILRRRAELGGQVARALAPVGGPGDPHPGEYRDGIQVVKHPAPHHSFPWRIGGYRILATAPYSLVLEVGRKRGNAPFDGQYVMARMARYLNTPRQGRKPKRKRKA